MQLLVVNLDDIGRQRSLCYQLRGCARCMLIQGWPWIAEVHGWQVQASCRLLHRLPPGLRADAHRLEASPPGGSWEFPGSQCRDGRRSHVPRTRVPPRTPCGNRVRRAGTLVDPNAVVQLTERRASPLNPILPGMLHPYGCESLALLAYLRGAEALQRAEGLHARHGFRPAPERRTMLYVAAK